MEFLSKKKGLFLCRRAIYKLNKKLDKNYAFVEIFRVANQIYRHIEKYKH